MEISTEQQLQDKYPKPALETSQPDAEVTEITKATPSGEIQFPQQNLKQTACIIRSICISFGAIFTGYILGSYSFVTATMSYVLDDDSAWISGLNNGLVSAGIGIGGFLGNALLNHGIKQRRRFIMLADVIAIFSCFLQMFATLYCIFPARFLGGIAAGFNFLICPVYIKEYVPFQYIGTCISIYSNSVNMGVMISYLVGFSLDYDVSKNVPYIWRINLAFPIIFCIFRQIAIFYFYKFDTPTYYFTQNEDETAKMALGFTHDNGTLQQSADFYKNQLIHTEQTRVKFLTLLTKKYRMRLLMSIFSASSEALTGLMIFTAYSWMIYGQVLEQKLSLTFSILQVAVQILGTSLLGKLLQKYGRKQIMVKALFVCLLAHIGQTVTAYLLHEDQSNKNEFVFKFFTVFFLQLYYACLGLGISVISFLVVVDLVPQSGIGCSNSFMALFNCIYSFGFPVLIEVIPLWQALMIITICTFIVVMLYQLWVIETKNLNEYQIDEIFNKKKK